MRLDATYEVRDNRLWPPDRRATKSDSDEIIDFHALADDDVLVIAKERCGACGDGKTHYVAGRLMPVDDIDTSSFDNPLYLFPKAKRRRGSFIGTYRVVEMYLSITPGRHRGMVRELRRLLFAQSMGVRVGWSSLRLLDGIRLRKEIGHVLSRTRYELLAEEPGRLEPGRQADGHGGSHPVLVPDARPELVADVEKASEKEHATDGDG